MDTSLVQVTQDTWGNGKFDATTRAVEQMAQAIGDISQGPQEQAKAVEEASQITAQIIERVNLVKDARMLLPLNATGAAKSAHSGEANHRGQCAVHGTVKTSTRLVQEKMALMGSTRAKWLISRDHSRNRCTDQFAAFIAAIEAARAGETRQRICRGGSMKCASWLKEISQSTNEIEG
jgi:methyl-accepting chemotaxis protein